MSRRRLLLVTDAVGGVWIYSLELARALRPLGVETVLALSGPPPTTAQREAAADFTLIDTGLPLEWLDRDPDAIVRAGRKLARLAALEGADVLQTCSAALLAGATFECATVAVQHSCVATWWRAVKEGPLADAFEWRRSLVKRGLERADAIVAPTRAFAAATEAEYSLDRKVAAVHNGRTVRHSRTLPRGNFAFTAGRLWDEGKNAGTLDRAAARLRAPIQAAGPTVGPNGAIFPAEHLMTLGELSEEKLGGVLAARPIYASAALYEPFGLSVLEAAQAGCALVLSDIATHRELWGGAAVFVEARDSAAFAEAIGDLLENPALRQRLGARARRRARHYAPERTAASMAEIYRCVAAAQPELVAGAA